MWNKTVVIVFHNFTIAAINVCLKHRENCEDTTKFNMRQIINGLLNYFILIKKIKELFPKTETQDSRSNLMNMNKHEELLNGSCSNIDY